MKSTKPMDLKGVVAMFGLVVLLGLLGGLGSAFLSERPGVGGVLGMVVFVSVVMAAVLAVAVLWWRRLDEAAQEAHKWAWYWGGSGGMLAGLVVMLVLTSRDDIALPAAFGQTPAELVGGGVMLILGLQLLGYGVAWVWWWLARR